MALIFGELARLCWICLSLAESPAGGSRAHFGSRASGGILTRPLVRTSFCTKVPGSRRMASRNPGLGFT